MWVTYLFSEQLDLQDRVGWGGRGSWCGELRPRHLMWDACVSTATDNSDQRSEQASAASALDPDPGDPDPALSVSLFYFGGRSFQSFHQKHEYW